MYTVECIPNISSADPKTIEAVTAAIQAVPDITLHHVDSGRSANRTVFTYTGPVDRVFEATEGLFAATLAHVDMRLHTGVHPRMGAVDVCPFVLLDDEKHKPDLLSRTDAFASRLGQFYHVPIYLYEESAKQSGRTLLADVRHGQYEGLHDRFALGDLPDHGPLEWNDATARHGATALGVRPLMIAYNINLTGLPKATLLDIARKIAATIREKNGGMPGVRSIGWYLQDMDTVQVSCNLTQPEKAGVCEVFRRVRRLAEAEGCMAPSSELIGCIPQSQFQSCAPEELGFGGVHPFDTRRILPF